MIWRSSVRGSFSSTTRNKFPVNRIFQLQRFYGRGLRLEALSAFEAHSCGPWASHRRPNPLMHSAELIGFWWKGFTRITSWLSTLRVAMLCFRRNNLLEVYFRFELVDVKTKSPPKMHLLMHRNNIIVRQAVIYRDSFSPSTDVMGWHTVTETPSALQVCCGIDSRIYIVYN